MINIATVHIYAMAFTSTRLCMQEAHAILLYDIPSSKIFFFFFLFLMMYYINGDRCDEYLWWPHQSCFHFHGRYQFLSILKWICAIGMRVYIILHRQCICSLFWMRSFVENSYGELWHAHWLVVIQCIVRYRKFIDVICDVIQTEMPYHSLSFSIQHCVAEVFNLLLKCRVHHFSWLKYTLLHVEGYKKLYGI